MKNIKTRYPKQVGATSVEYALLASLLAIVIAASIELIGTNLDSSFLTIVSSVEVVSVGSENSEQRLSTGSRNNTALDDDAGLSKDQLNPNKKQDSQSNSILQSVFSSFR